MSREKIDNDLQQMAKNEWIHTKVKSKKSDLSWDLRMTEAFPDSWPMGSDSKMTVYLYSASLDANIRDGEHTSDIWGKIEYRKGQEKNLKFTRLSQEVSEIGIQGVRPLNPKDSEKISENSAEFFCRWLKNNGTIAETLIKSHISKLYKELKCGSP